MTKRIKAIFLIAFAMVCLLLIKGIFHNEISSIEDFRMFINSFGIMGPVILVLIQAFQVVVPILPGYLGCAVGAICFGTKTGFLCNYIGISAGSIIAFLLAKRYGKKLVTEMFSEMQYEKWLKKIEGKKSYEAFLLIATLLPMFPDDFLCYFSGLMDMRRKRFIWIILLGKPWCILAYSIAFGLIL